MRPDSCYRYNQSIPFSHLVAELLSYYDGNPADFPQVSTLYMDQPDTAGHRAGPFGDWVRFQYRIYT